MQDCLPILTIEPGCDLSFDGAGQANAAQCVMLDGAVPGSLTSLQKIFLHCQHKFMRKRKTVNNELLVVIIAQTVHMHGILNGLQHTARARQQ